MNKTVPWYVVMSLYHIVSYHICFVRSRLDFVKMLKMYGYLHTLL